MECIKHTRKFNSGIDMKRTCKKCKIEKDIEVFTSPYHVLKIKSIPAESNLYNGGGRLSGTTSEKANIGMDINAEWFEIASAFKPYNSPFISSFYPSTSYQGQTVSIIGSYFTGVTGVSFGGTAATSFNVVSDTLITAVVGSGTSGTIQVITPFGSSSLAGFVYFKPWSRIQSITL